MSICQQPGLGLRWTISNLPGGISDRLTVDISSLQAGAVLNFRNDPYGFEIHILSSSSASTSVLSELRVTAVRELNGVTVECFGLNGTFVSTIQISSACESMNAYLQ